MKVETKNEVRGLVALIIDDEQSIRETLSGVFSDEGWATVTAKDGREGLLRFVKDRPDLVLLDVWMPGLDGIEVLQKIKEINRLVPVIIMSGHSTIETAVRATKLGAFDFLEKPLSLDKLLPMLDHAKELHGKGLSLRDEEGKSPLIGNSEVITQILRQIDLVAPRNAWVLITGENGTGKEVVARKIHEKSARSKRPFVAVNCAAIPEHLIESELFGHTKGAFTDAVSNKIGRFEQANQGTLFLDEIGDMSLKTQAKILRILQEQKFERVGSIEAIGVDVRVIAATNKNLEEEIKKGNFREDLFYRLNVVPFHLPPLRERGRDILLLSEYFLEQISHELKEPRKTLSQEVQKLFLGYEWPGNIRELKNLLERLCILVPGNEISEKDVVGLIHPRDVSLMDTHGIIGASATLKQAKNDFEKAFILGKLEENQWNVSKTADAIGIERSNLHRKLKSYEIDPKKLKG